MLVFRAGFLRWIDEVPEALRWVDGCTRGIHGIDERVIRSHDTDLLRSGIPRLPQHNCRFNRRGDGKRSRSSP